MPATTTTNKGASLVTIDSANNANNMDAAKLVNQDSITINHDSVNIFKDNSVDLTISGNLVMRIEQGTLLDLNYQGINLNHDANLVIEINRGARLDLSGIGTNSYNNDIFLKIAEGAEINFNGNSVNMTGEVVLSEIINHYDL